MSEFHPQYKAPPSPLLPTELLIKLTIAFPLLVKYELISQITAPPLVALLLLNVVMEFPSNVILELVNEHMAPPS